MTWEPERKGVQAPPLCTSALCEQATCDLGSLSRTQHPVGPRGRRGPPGFGGGGRGCGAPGTPPRDSSQAASGQESSPAPGT